MGVLYFLLIRSTVTASDFLWDELATWDAPVQDCLNTYLRVTTWTTASVTASVLTASVTASLSATDSESATVPDLILWKVWVWGQSKRKQATLLRSDGCCSHCDSQCDSYCGKYCHSCCWSYLICHCAWFFVRHEWVACNFYASYFDYHIAWFLTRVICGWLVNSAWFFVFAFALIVIVYVTVWHF